MQDQVADVGAFFDPIHRQRTPNEALFSSKSQTFGLGQTIWADKFWGIAFGVFSADSSAPLSLFSINQPLILQKKLSLYTYSKPKDSFGIGI